ncbi:hypothetical protein VSS74_24770 [Conexibacter stalactiti]|uniref:Uncharacterized protein n=1 Tax=Conexibacter stalactiti TaxID=1940611 RepID=A0ABU4HW89_9ACTN|nr:hypothetical protein [Conexibacter stalactiti]MDW5597587.1 hypothetical protein [Conexibacter stalactiti]MEC5038229.1 hypothetical protein [Conexibacter stalactiti]
MRQIVRLVSLAVFAAVLLAALPSLASADRAAIRSERIQLREAVTRSKLVPRPIRAGDFTLRRARISTEGRWAISTIAPTGAARRTLDAVAGMFRHARGRWTLVEVGTAGVGCAKLIVPRDVRRDLGIVCAVA